MKITLIYISRFFLMILFWNSPFCAIAQKLPKIQQTGKRAPADIKIDGKTTEWNDEFQAYNTISRIYYTISNDDSNLYLTLCTGDIYGSEKALYGISFTIKLPVEKGDKSKENVVVKFPPLSATEKHEPIRFSVIAVRRLQNDTTNAAKKKKDSLRLVVNKSIKEVFKEINVTGINLSGKRSISIYNTEGIKVAAQLNDHYQYMYELAIPLKCLGPSISSGQKFSFNIKMDGVEGEIPNGQYAPPMLTGGVSAMRADEVYVQYPTDFSGTYTVVKK